MNKTRRKILSIIWSSLTLVILFIARDIFKDDLVNQLVAIIFIVAIYFLILFEIAIQYSQGKKSNHVCHKKSK